MDNFDEQPVGGRSKVDWGDEVPVGGSGSKVDWTEEAPAAAANSDAAGTPIHCLLIIFIYSFIYLVVINDVPVDGTLDELPIRAKGSHEVGDESAGMSEQAYIDTRKIHQYYLSTHPHVFMPAGPLCERIIDKNWKSRASAYEDIVKEINNGNNAIFSEYENHIVKILADSNASALDTGLDAVLLFIDKTPNTNGACLLTHSLTLSTAYSLTHSLFQLLTHSLTHLGVLNYLDKILSNIIDKVFNASRPATQNKGKSVLLKLMEIDEPTAVTKYLLTKLGDKKVKIPPTCLEVIKEGNCFLTRSLTHLSTHSLATGILHGSIDTQSSWV